MNDPTDTPNQPATLGALSQTPRRGAPLKLSPTRTEAICNDIRRGAFPQVATQAHGVSRSTFHSWMSQGRRARERIENGERIGTPERAYLDFLEQVETAQGCARRDAERRVFEENPLAYLRLGPGRDQGPDNPGWTETATAHLGVHLHAASSVDTEDLIRRVFGQPKPPPVLALPPATEPEPGEGEG